MNTLPSLNFSDDKDFVSLKSKLDSLGKFTDIDDVNLTGGLGVAVLKKSVRQR